MEKILIYVCVCGCVYTVAILIPALYKILIHSYLVLFCLSSVYDLWLFSKIINPWLSTMGKPNLNILKTQERYCLSDYISNVFFLRQKS